MSYCFPQAQERFSEVHKLLQETIKLLLEGSNRLTTAMMLVSNSNSDTADQVQTPLVAMNTPTQPSSTCDITPPPDFQADLTAIEPTQTQICDSIINNVVTPLTTYESTFSSDTPNTMAVAKELGGLSNDIEAYHSVGKFFSLKYIL